MSELDIMREALERIADKEQALAYTPMNENNSELITQMQLRACGDIARDALLRAGKVEEAKGYSESDAWDAFEAGYMQGHNDTVESCVRDSKEAAQDYFAEHSPAPHTEERGCETCRWRANDLIRCNACVCSKKRKLPCWEPAASDGKHD